jgi:hypothetical protein
MGASPDMASERFPSDAASESCLQNEIMAGDELGPEISKNGNNEHDHVLRDPPRKLSDLVQILNLDDPQQPGEVRLCAFRANFHGEFTQSSRGFHGKNLGDVLSDVRTMDASFLTGKPKRSFAEDGSPQTAVSLAGQVSVVIPYAVSGRKGVNDHPRHCTPDMSGWCRFKALAQAARNL